MELRSRLLGFNSLMTSTPKLSKRSNNNLINHAVHSSTLTVEMVEKIQSSLYHLVTKILRGRWCISGFWNSEYFLCYIR